MFKIAKGDGASIDDPRIKELIAQADELYTTVAASVAPLIFLGPEDVASAYHDMQMAYESGDDEALGNAEVAFRDAARRALGVKS